MVASFAPTTRSVVLPDGTRALAGLIWDRAPAVALPRIGAPGWELRHGACRAALPAGIAAERDTSLLLLLANRLAEKSHIEGAALRPGIWLLLADVSEPGRRGHGLGTVELEAGPDGPTVRPVIGPEDVFASATALAGAVGALAATLALSGIALAEYPEPEPGSADLAALIPPVLEEAGLTGAARLPLIPVPLTARPEIVPALAPRPGVSTRTALLAGAASAALMLAALALPGLIAQAQRPDPAPVTPMLRVAPAPGGFAAACTEALGDWWPRIVGWRYASGGCALAGFLPDTIAPEALAAAGEDLSRAEVPLIVWRDLMPDGTVNTVLAARAAETVLADWPHGRTLTGEGQTLWQRRAVPLTPADPADAPRGGISAAGVEALPEDARAARLEALWADRPGAVSRTEAGFRITAPGRAETVLARLAGLAGLAPVRLMQGRDAVSVDLAPPAARLLPASHLASREDLS